jgi:hypothetical protein
VTKVYCGSGDIVDVISNISEGAYLLKGAIQ